MLSCGTFAEYGIIHVHLGTCIMYMCPLIENEFASGHCSREVCMCSHRQMLKPLAEVRLGPPSVMKPTMVL